MEKIIAVLCIAALGVTAVDGYVEISGVELPGFTPENKEENGEMSTIETVTVPENKLREIVHYDHIIRIEFSWENKSSGEWMFWALDVSGQELLKIPGISTQQDGFGEEHSVLYLRRELAAQFTVFADSSDGETITSDGEYDIQRDEYTDLNEEKTLRIDNNANISVDQLQSTNVPLSFRGYMRSYFDPWEPKLETLEDSVYGEGQTIELGEEGDFVDEMSWSDITYHWVAERGRIIAGYETILINVSTDFGDDDFSLPFKQEIWISNEVPEPVKMFIRTNTSWEGEEEAGYFLLENTFTLREKGFTEGNSPIPWGDCTGYHWLSEHQLAETEDWKYPNNYMPKSGNDFEDSSFDFMTEDLITYLVEDTPSTGLDQFLSQNPDTIVTSATYNASKDSNDEKAGEYWWNITFGFPRRDDQQGSSYRIKNRYRVLVVQITTFEWVNPPGEPPYKDYQNEFRLEKDFGEITGTSPLYPDDISSQTVTLASSEKIFRTEDKVIENFYPYEDLGVEEIEWGDGDETEYSLGASSGQQGFGMDLVATLTGIQTQTWSKYYWSISKEDLLEGGSMSSASLDAETGRLISIMELEGTALQDAFKWG